LWDDSVVRPAGAISESHCSGSPNSEFDKKRKREPFPITS
jgi:hypothetical protein